MLKTMNATMKHIAIACLAGFCISGHSAELAGRVVGVADGDTLTVLDSQNMQHKIRLGGIDAPEKKQPFGNRSKEALSDCAFGKSVVVEWDKTDRYQRKVGKVIASGIDCNLRQLKLGMAWHYKKYAGEQSQGDKVTYAKSEDVARGARTGLWTDSAPVAPWDFRAETRQK